MAIAQKAGATIEECCAAIEVPERTFYRLKTGPDLRKRGRRSAPTNKLTLKERRSVVKLLLAPDTINLTPREIYYKNADEKQLIIASPATLYRVAKSDGLLVRRSKTEVTGALNRDKPCLVATSENQIWSWDVSQIRSAFRNQRYYLYVILDIWSRYVVGWALEENEKTDKAIALWKRALETQYLSGKGLTNHKDNGSIMRSGEMIKFVKDAQMIDSYSRAGVSDDNPFSEALFRTIKYFRTFPDFFESLENGRDYFETYFHEYNYEYRHSGIQFITPAQRHYGEEEKILNLRNKILKEFYEKNSHRFSSRHKIFHPIKVVKIN